MPGFIHSSLHLHLNDFLVRFDNLVSHCTINLKAMSAFSARSSLRVYCDLARRHFLHLDVGFFLHLIHVVDGVF